MSFGCRQWHAKRQAISPRVGPGRKSLSNLSRPKNGFRVDKALHNGAPFLEIVEASCREDTGRSTGMSGAQQLTAEDQATAQDLAAELKRGADQLDPPLTLASSLYMREVRIRVTGAVWQLHDELADLPRSVFTIIPRSYWLTPENLRVLDVRRVMRALRSALNRAGAGHATGGLILFLHGEWDEATGRYQLHFHCWAAGGMVKVVRQLRKQRAYNSTEAARANDVDGVRHRVVISRKPITNPAYRLSYLIQSFWPSRPTGVLPETEDGPGSKFRVRGKRRIPEPQHSQQLVWLHQWRLEDISLLLGLHVVQGRLRLRAGRAAYTNGMR